MSSDNDFSAILQLMDVKHLYEDQEEKWRLRLEEKDQEIARYAAQLEDQRRTVEGRSESATGLQQEIIRLKAENERLQRDFQAKIGQLNERIKVLNQRVLTAEQPKVAQGIFKK